MAPKARSRIISVCRTAQNSGTFKISGVPLRHVNQAYVIATQTKVGVSGVDVQNIDNTFFTKQAEQKKKMGERELFKAEKEEKIVSPQEKKDAQKLVDAPLTKNIEAIAELKAYLGTRFSLKSGMKARELVY